MDETSDQESVEVMREARALDRAMEERMVARKASTSSVGSSNGLGMGSAWKSRYGSRARTGSVTSNFTSAGSIISEDLIEESEEPELLGVGGGFDCPSFSQRSPSGETTEDEPSGFTPNVYGDVRFQSPFHDVPFTARPELNKRHTFDGSSIPSGIPPSAPPTKTSFGFASRLTSKWRGKSRTPTIDVLPPVPPSPVVANAITTEPESVLPSSQPRARTKRIPEPLKLQNPTPRSRTSSRSSQLSHVSSIHTPAETLFVFPPSPTLKPQTPHMMTVTSNKNGNILSPYLVAAPTPRVSTFRTEGRRRSFISLGAPATPTTASSRVDVRGWVGVNSL